jgi:Glycosyltransferase family 87
MNESQSMAGRTIVKRPVAKAALWVLLSLLAASCMAFYVTRIWSAGQPAQFSDLYARWWGAHELFLHGRNPYTPPVAREIQTVIYGAPQTARYRGDSSELAGGFAYPLYTVFLLWPTVYLSFATVQILFVCGSILVTLGSIPLWLRAFDFRVSLAQSFTLMVLTLGSFPAMQGIWLQNLSLIAVALLAGAVALLATRHLTLAGIFLAVSTFKPQFTIVLIPWLALWTASDWCRRQYLAWSFLTSMLLLIGGSEWLEPGWISCFIRTAEAYKHYTFGHSLLDVWFTSRGGPWAAAALLLTVLALCWQRRRHSEDSPGFFLAISFILASTLVVIPTLAPHAHLLLLPSFLCLLRYRSSFSRSVRFARPLLLAVWILLVWPWVAAAFLMMADVVLPIAALLPWWELPLYTSPVLPFAVLPGLAFLMSTRQAPGRDFDVVP